MPDTDLHDLLTEISDLVVPADLLPRVAAGIRTQRRRRVVLASGATLLVVAATTFVGLHLSAGGGSSSPPIATPTPTPTHTSGRQSSTSVLPTYLPPGATLRHTGPVRFPRNPNGSRLHQKHPTLFSWYHLAGRDNADTMPAGGATPATVGNLAIHPGTSLTVEFVPDSNLGGHRSLRRLLPTLGAGRGEFGLVRVIIAGNHAVITLDNNEHGAFRIDWLDPAGYHTIGSDRLVTPHGLSGVGRHDLVRMARSLYR